LSLPQAIEKARALYQSDGKAPVAKEAAVKAWGYKGLNGASLRVLGALNQYGLLDTPESRTVRLSPRALAILLEPEDSNERAQAIIGAVNEPPVFGEIMAHYPDGLPGDEGLKSYLVRTLNFRDAAAIDLIASLRDTIALAESVANVNTSPNEGRKEKQSPQRGGTMPVTAGQTFTYSLPEGVVASVTISGKPATGEGVKVLRQFLDLVKQSIGVATAESPPPSEQS